MTACGQNRDTSDRVRRHASRLLPSTLLAIGVAATGHSAMAQVSDATLPSPTDYSAGAGSFRDTVSGLVNPPATVSLGRPWTFNGALTVQAGATNNAGGTGTGWQPLLLVSPTFNLNGVTSRLNVSLSYSPVLSYYPSTSNESLLSHTFNGIATLTVIPDWLYITARGTTALESRFGGGYLYNNSIYSTNDAVQTSSFSISPYIQHQFGGIGTLTVAYAYSASFQNADNFPVIAPNATSTAGYGTLGNLQTSTESASFVTGENFGRVQDAVSVSASQNSGSTFYNNSSTITANNELSYALTRWLTLIGDVGYESYDYPSSGYRLNDVTWAVGATVIPNADSSITVKYGRRAGSNTVLASGTYSPTARTRVFVNYNVDIQTGLGSQQALLSTTLVGPGGLLVDRATGAPVIGNGYYGNQFTLSRVKTLTVGGALLLDRDSFNLTFSRTELQQLVNSQSVFGVNTPAGLTTDASYTTLGWQHELNPSNSLYSAITYTNSNNGAYFGNANGSQDTLQLYTNLSHTFTDSLYGNVSYSHSERFGNAVSNLPAIYGGNASQDTFLVGLTKTF